jgi:hypothetical protein
MINNKKISNWMAARCSWLGSLPLVLEHSNRLRGRSFCSCLGLSAEWGFVLRSAFVRALNDTLSLTSHAR